MLNILKLFKKDPAKKIKELAKKSGWNLICEQTEPPMVSFIKERARINVYYTTMTVATIIPHPKLGKNQLFRKNVSMETLKLIFNKPRVHTNKGYRIKR